MTSFVSGRFGWSVHVIWDKTHCLEIVVPQRRACIIMISNLHDLYQKVNFFPIPKLFSYAIPIGNRCIQATTKEGG